MLVLVLLYGSLTWLLKHAHVIDWSPWLTGFPTGLGIGLWIAWTRLKIWAVKKTENISGQEEG